MEKALEQEVRDRAGGLCEYCHFPESVSELRHVIDHIIAQQHRGETISENLALACGRCNRHKGPNLAGIDPASRVMVRLFNPRTDRWPEHFRWSDAKLIGLTDIGRATVEVLAVNHPSRVTSRRTLLRLRKLRLG